MSPAEAEVPGDWVEGSHEKESNLPCGAAVGDGGNECSISVNVKIAKACRPVFGLGCGVRGRCTTPAGSTLIR